MSATYLIYLIPFFTCNIMITTNHSKASIILDQWEWTPLMFYHVHILVEETGLIGLIVLHTLAVRLLGTNKKAHLARDSRHCSLDGDISRLSLVELLHYCALIGWAPTLLRSHWLSSYIIVLSLVELLHYFALIGRELHSVESLFNSVAKYASSLMS